MSKLTAQPQIEVNIKEKRKPDPPSLSLEFPEGQKVQPKGFETLTIDGEVSCTVKGKITSLSTQQWSDDKTKSIRIEITSCAFSADREKPMSMDEAMDEAKKTRKRV